jgi:outer membrane protein OmpA-like peptidoglycan-associated protein
MAQTGKCTNTVGCTLAYTGQEIRFEGSAVCPECGQPLTLLTKPKTSSKLWLVIVALVVLVAVAGGGFYAVERLLTASDSTKTSDNTKATPTATASAATQSQSDGKMVDGKSQVPADVLNKANNQSTQSPTPQPASSAASPTVTPEPETQQSPPGPKESPAPNNGDKPPQSDASSSGGKSPPAGNGSPDVRHQNPGPQKSPDSGSGDNSGQTVDTKPKELSSAELGATKEDIKKRINSIPRMSDSEKTKLIDKLDSAQYMQRVGVVYFPTGSTVLPKPAVDKLVSLFKAQELVQKMSDPTLVFIVAGYADMTGDPKGNYKLSDERAQAVANVLPDAAGVLNLVRTVPMGGTDLLSGRRPDQNRAVEIWAVIPQ